MGMLFTPFVGETTETRGVEEAKKSKKTRNSC